jgi:hypothetical protein
LELYFCVALHTDGVMLGHKDTFLMHAQYGGSVKKYSVSKEKKN